MTAHADALLRVDGGSAGRSKQAVVGLLPALGLGGHAAFDGGGGQGVAHGLPCMAAQRIARHAGRAACRRARYGALGDVCRLAHRSLRGGGDELTLVKAKSQIRQMWKRFAKVSYGGFPGNKKPAEAGCRQRASPDHWPWPSVGTSQPPHALHAAGPDVLEKLPCQRQGLATWLHAVLRQVLGLQGQALLFCGDGVHHRQGDRLIGVHGPLCAIACAFFPSAWLAATATQLKATVLGMKAAVLGKIARAANEGHLLDTPDAISVLVEWRKWEGSTDVHRQWLQALVASDEQLPRLLLHFARQDWFKTSSMNPHLFLREMALEVVDARVRALVRK